VVSFGKTMQAHPTALTASLTPALTAADVAELALVAGSATPVAWCPT
jgi:hypothetical protein